MLYPRPRTGVMSKRRTLSSEMVKMEQRADGKLHTTATAMSAAVRRQ